MIGEQRKKKNTFKTTKIVERRLARKFAVNNLLVQRAQLRRCLQSVQKKLLTSTHTRKNAEQTLYGCRRASAVNR